MKIVICIFVIYINIHNINSKYRISLNFNYSFINSLYVATITIQNYIDAVYYFH